VANNLDIPIATTEVGGFHHQKLNVTNSAGVVAETATAYVSVRLTDGAAFYAAGGGGGSTQYAEDVASVGGESLMLAGAVRRDTPASSSGTDGDYSTLNTDASGRLWCSAKVDTALPAGTNNIGDVDVLTVPADPFGANADAASATGSISAKLRFIAATGIPVTGSVAVTGTFWQATQPVSAAALPLPSGAATAAKQPSLGVAGTASTDVITVQGIASMTAIQVDGSAVTQPVSVSSLPLPAGAATETTLSSLNGKVTACNTGAVTVSAVPADPFGINADAASATGSISAKLRFIASTGIPITGSVAVTIAAGAASIAKAEDVASADGDVGTPCMAVRKAAPANTSGTDGDYEMLQMSAGRLWCSATIDAALPAGSNVIGTVTASNAAGDIAHDGVDSGNPVKVGGKATAPFTFPAAVASGDRTNLTTDLYGRPHVVIRPDDVKRLGVYFYHSGALVIGASADGVATAGGGRIWVNNPVGSAVTVRIRKVTFRSQLASALVAVTSPRFTLEKGVFTGTDTGAAITPAKRRTADATAVGACRTAVTGMTISSAAVVASFFPIASATAVAYNPPSEAIFDPGLEDYIDLAAGECLILRQADAGTTSDTRRVTCDFVVEEF